MPFPGVEAGQMTWVNATGKQVITSGNAIIIGVGFVGTASGQVQFFAGVTASASMTPVITFSATTSAVAAGLSPMFFRMPAYISGQGFIVDAGGVNDPNLLIFWSPAGNPT